MFVGKSRLVGCIPINSPMKSPKIPDFAQFSPFNPHLPVFFHKFPMDLTIFLHISSSFHSHPLGFTRPHIQNARLGTEGTKGEAQATLKLHGAVDLRWGLVFTSLLLWKVWDYTHSPDWLRSKIIYFQTKSASFGGIHLNLQVLVTVDVCFFGWFWWQLKDWNLMSPIWVLQEALWGVPLKPQCIIENSPHVHVSCGENDTGI